MLSMSEIIIPFIAVLLIVSPLYMIFKGGINRKNAKSRIIAQISVFAGAFLICLLVQANQFTALAEDAAAAGATSSAGLGFIAAAISTGASSLGAGLAVAKAAPAAIGAISENPDNFGKAMIFVALGEGIAIYGLLISILIINQL